MRYNTPSDPTLFNVLTTCIHSSFAGPRTELLFTVVRGKYEMGLYNFTFGIFFGA